MGKQDEGKAQAPGDMSQHMVARWYRPPEIILSSNIYSEKLDIWSVGCVMAELAYVWRRSENGKNEGGDRYLFKGSSCYPLSPKPSSEKSKTKVNISKNDQLIKIIEILGPQDTTNLGSFDENQKYYLENIQNQVRDKFSLNAMFDTLEGELLQLLEGML